LGLLLGHTIALRVGFDNCRDAVVPGVAGDLETIRKLLCLGAQLWVGNPMKWSEPGLFGPCSADHPFAHFRKLG
jgi:hypothetical protein